MAKKASTSQKIRTASSSSPPSPRPLAATSNERMVLRVRPSKKMKRLAEMSSSDNEQGEERPMSSAKRSKPSSSSKKKKKNKNDKFDPNKPKKPPTAFFYFLEDFRIGYQEQNPNVKSMRDIGKACGEKWKSMTYEEKVQYYDIANEKRREFDQAMAEYIKRKESADDDDEGGEDDETESD